MRLAIVIGVTGFMGAALFLGGCSTEPLATGKSGITMDGAPEPPQAPGAAETSARGQGGTPGIDASAADPMFTSGANHAPASPDQSIRQLALYGQLPDSAAKPASAPDSPDNLTHVTFAFEGGDFDPAIDPTGQWLVYASTQHRQTADIYLKRVNGTTITQLTSDAGNHVMPAFSPDGKRVAFASDRGGNFAIYVMDVDGGQPVQITSDTNDNIHPSFSHDGKQLVYCSQGGQSGQWEMVVVDVDNPASKHIIGNGLFPTFSPADNRILFQRARERGSHWFSIWTMDLVNDEGMHPTEIAASSNAALITPAWSADGKHIAFCTVMDPGPDEHDRPPQSDIWIIGDDGAGRTNLTHGTCANLQPAWAHDGTIYFTSNRGKEGNENIWSIRPQPAQQAASDQADVNRSASAPTP